jgi:cytochrome c-type biogenesis protein CcmH/NrfG/transglutaminase-like putative cysteine protease
MTGDRVIYFLPFYRAPTINTQAMIRSWGILSRLTVVIAALLTSRAQTTPSREPSKTDYSQEAAIIELLSTKLAFENDGKFRREQTSRVRVQTDAGVQHWGLLSFPFQSSTQAVEIEYVRVQKSDGTTVITPPDNVQDLDSEITRSAPFYSDLREKHVAVKGLGKGDTVEYKVQWHSTKPLIPGQFWFSYNFHHDGIVLEERLEIGVPVERAVKVKGPQATQTVKTESGSRIYSWTYSKLDSAKEPAHEQKRESEAARGHLPAPEVQITSFQNWDEVGRWYWGLQKDRIEPTVAIRVKAAELTKGLTDEDAKLRALYSFVSTQYRYIGIAFGIGRYQPHAADDVLTNNYGDCKDKHTLLAALLQSSGITLYPALISSSMALDKDIPSPAQFDHVIGYLPRGKGKQAVWLDTTVEVAPFGYLVPRLRNKPTLVMSSDNGMELVDTPADPLFQNTEAFHINAKLNEDGTLEAKIEDTTRGDSEVLLRAAFRQVAQPEWKDLVQRISYAMGYAGTVSDINASKPETVSEPFHFTYSYNRKDYPDWKTDQRIVIPSVPFFLPPVRDDASYPVWLGSPFDATSDSKVELPAGYRPDVPPNVDLKYDFAEYHASYSADGGAVVAKRHLITKMHEIPMAEFDDYRSFVKNLQNDVNRYMQTSSLKASRVASPSLAAAQFLRDLRELPDSSSSEANRLESEGRNAISKQDMAGAVSPLQKAVSADPKFARAWVFLGMMLFAQKETDSAIDAFQKAIQAQPSQTSIPKALGYSLMAESHFKEAVPVWQDYIKANPEDADGPGNLGRCFAKLNRHLQAATAFEAAVKLKGDRPDLQMGLASEYLEGGEVQKAADAFQKIAEMDSQGIYLNDVAYKMAKADLRLPTALEYSRRAVHGVEEESQKIALSNLKVEDARSIFRLAAYWDTLGWVYERMSNLEPAEQYLRASWKLTQDGTVAGHLCHLYKRTHKIALAIEMCRLAVYRIPMSEGLPLSEYAGEMEAAQENLKNLAGSATQTKNPDASDLVIRERTFKLPRFLPGTESAEFFILLASDGKSKSFRVDDVKFISGSAKMKLQGKQLRGIDFGVPAPSEVPAHFVRRGILGCYEYSGCAFVLLDPATVRSVN